MQKIRDLQGADLITYAETMLQWAKTMTWNSLHPVVALSRTAYEKGVSLTKQGHACRRSAFGT